MKPNTCQYSHVTSLMLAPVWARRLITASTLRLGVLSLWVVPSAKHELAGHQGVGESPPRAAGHRSKLNSFLLAKQGYPRPTPIPVLVGLRFVGQLQYSETVANVPQISAPTDLGVGQLHYSETVANVPQISALLSAPKQFWFPFQCFHLNYQWFVKRCV